jgi:hypothetical protein
MTCSEIWFTSCSEKKKYLTRISNVPDVIKYVSQFVIIFIKRKNYQIYILGIFFCSFTNTANRYVSAPQALNFPLFLEALKFKKKRRIMISSTWAFNRDEWRDAGCPV